MLELVDNPLSYIKLPKASVSRGLKNTDPKELNNNLLVDTGINIVDKKIRKEISSITGSRITLTHNEVKDIMKVIKPLQNRGILLKATTKKINSYWSAGLPWMKYVLTPLATGVLIPLQLAATVSTTISVTQKISGSGTAALIICNEETEDIVKIVKSLEAWGLLKKEINETIKNEQKNKYIDFSQFYYKRKLLMC